MDEKLYKRGDIIMKTSAMEPGTIFIWKTVNTHMSYTCLVLRGPLPDSKLNMHRVYRFERGDIFPYLPDGDEEILG